MKKTSFALNLIVVLALSLAAAFFVSTKVYYEQWHDMMLKVEEVLEDKRFNFAEIAEDAKPLTESMTYNLNNQIFLVANQKRQVGGDILNQAYFNPDFKTYAVVVSNDGWLVTNQIMRDTNLVVIDQNNQVIVVEELVIDNTLGLSYLKIDKTDLDPVAIANSDNLETGDLVYGIKPNMCNYQHDILANSIKSLHTRSIKNRVDLVYQPGDVIYGLLNSEIDDNLPLINNKSQFIGFSVNIDNQSYLLPSKYIRYSLTQLFKENNEIVYPSLDINYIDLSEVVLDNELANKGAYVYNVLNSKSPLKKGDILVKVENDEINKVRSLNDILLDYKIGQEISVSLIRGAEEIELKLTIKAFNE